MRVEDSLIHNLFRTHSPGILSGRVADLCRCSAYWPVCLPVTENRPEFCALGHAPSNPFFVNSTLNVAVDGVPARASNFSTVVALEKLRNWLGFRPESEHTECQ